MRRLLRLLACLAVAAPVVVAVASRADAYFYPNRYQIQAWHSGKCLDVVNGSGANGARIQQWDCNPNTWQQEWAFDRVGDAAGSPVFKISSRHTLYTKCLDAVNGAMSWGTPIQQFDCSASTIQQMWIQEFMFTNAGGQALFRYHSLKQPGVCLDVSGASTENGARLVLWGCHNGGNQLFANNDLGPM